MILTKWCSFSISFSHNEPVYQSSDPVVRWSCCQMVSLWPGSQSRAPPPIAVFLQTLKPGHVSVMIPCPLGKHLERPVMSQQRAWWESTSVSMPGCYWWGHVLLSEWSIFKLFIMADARYEQWSVWFTRRFRIKSGSGSFFFLFFSYSHL